MFSASASVAYSALPNVGASQAGLLPIEIEARAARPGHLALDGRSGLLIEPS